MENSSLDEALESAIEAPVNVNRDVGDVTSTARGSGARYCYGKPPMSLLDLTVVALTMPDYYTLCEAAAESPQDHGDLQSVMWRLASFQTSLGEDADSIPVTAFKSQIGHLLGGAGGVETIAAIQTLRTSTIAPTINLEHPDPECDLDYVPLQPRSADVRTVAKNSFGFGGQNAVLILRRFED